MDRNVDPRGPREAAAAAGPDQLCSASWLDAGRWATRCCRVVLRCAKLALLLAVLLGSVSAQGQILATGPIYRIEAIEVHGNHKTRSHLVRRALLVRPGERLAVDDPAFELSRYRVLALGYFASVHLRLRKGATRGAAVLVVEVVERGTLVITDLFLGTSEATRAWGGLGLAERNLLGRGIELEGAFVLGTDPLVERARLQQSYWLSATAPQSRWRRLELGAALLLVDGSEFFRRSGSDASSSPEHFISAGYRRLGGSLGVSLDVGPTVRVRADQRVEAVIADLPVGATRELAVPTGTAPRSVPVPFDLIDGRSLLSVTSVTLEHDTRSDPVLPDRGALLTASADVSSRLFASRYSFVKLSASYRRYWALPWRHVAALQLFGGVVFGEAPFFEKFFIGDLSDLVPGRALGLNFSTLPSRNVFGTPISGRRYEDIALRCSGQYSIPWFRGGRFAYAGDFFIDAGLIFLAAKEDLQLRDRALLQSVPIDLTVDAGLRLDTRIGVFLFSVGNALGRIPF